MKCIKSFEVGDREPFKPIEVQLYSGSDEFGYEFWQDTGFGRVQKVNDCWGFKSLVDAEEVAIKVLGDVSQNPDFDTCPLCGGDLGVDEEYMQSRYGEAYMYESVQTIYFCYDCEETGTYKHLIKESYVRADEEKFRRGE